jgi:hypothetical protein
VLEGDVAEGYVGRIRREMKRLAVGNVTRPEPVDLAEKSDCLEATLKKSGIKIAGRYCAELASEGTGHSADTTTDLDKRLFFRIQGSKPKNGQIRTHFRIPGGDKLLQGKVTPLFIVEHPASSTHHLVAT